MEERQRDLLRAHEAEWTASLEELKIASRCEFRRGFVEKIAIAPQMLASQGAALFARFPIRELLLPLRLGGSAAIELRPS